MASAATKIALKEGEEQTGIDILMQVVSMARIDGTVVSPAGSASSTAEVTLTSLDAPAPNAAFAYGGRLGPRHPDAQGKFSFVGVPPGEYRLSATTDQRAVAEAASLRRRGRLIPSMAFATVSVNGDDLIEALTLRRGMAVTGRFAFDSETAPGQLSGARVTLRGLRVDQSRTINLFTADAQRNGAFS